jgi:hypothetical protein
MPRLAPALRVSCIVVALGLIVSLEARQATRPTVREPRPSPPATEPAVPFAPGETLTYDVSWSNLLTAGTTTVTVQDKRPSLGSTAYYVTAEGRPGGLVSAIYPIYYKADTLLDTRTLLPQRGSIYSDEKGRRRFRVTLFDQPAKSVRYEVHAGDPNNATTRLDLPVPAAAHDALSVIFRLRAMALSTRTKETLPVVVNGHVYEVQVTVAGRERVRCGLGEVDAWRLTPVLVDPADQSDGRDMALWLSDDARRLPLKLQASLPVGTFILTLSSATTPRTPRAA